MGSIPFLRTEAVLVSDFCTHHLKTRVPAVPMQPVVDPAEWTAESLGPVRGWSYRITVHDQDELLAAVRRFRKLCERSGLRKEMRRKAYYEKPSERRRREELKRLRKARQHMTSRV